MQVDTWCTIAHDTEWKYQFTSPRKKTISLEECRVMSQMINLNVGLNKNTVSMTYISKMCVYKLQAQPKVYSQRSSTFKNHMHVFTCLFAGAWGTELIDGTGV